MTMKRGQPLSKATYDIGGIGSFRDHENNNIDEEHEPFVTAPPSSAVVVSQSSSGTTSAITSVWKRWCLMLCIIALVAYRMGYIHGFDFTSTSMGSGGGDVRDEPRQRPPLGDAVSEEEVDKEEEKDRVDDDTNGGSGHSQTEVTKVAPAGKGRTYGNPQTPKKGKKSQSDDGSGKSQPVQTQKVESRVKPENIHPRVACFSHEECNLHPTEAVMKKFNSNSTRSAIYVHRSKSSLHSPSKDVKVPDYAKDCELSDPSYQTLPTAPSNCNEVHMLGLDASILGESFTLDASQNQTDYNAILRPSIRYVTSGAVNAVWKVSTIGEYGQEEQLVLKTNQVHKQMDQSYLSKNVKDAIVSERAGKILMPHAGRAEMMETQPAGWNNVVPLYAYCAFSNIVPYGDLGPLDTFVRSTVRDHYMDAMDILYLALQAARGLYQSHLYSDGKATNAHADVKPPQYLLFHPPTASNGAHKNRGLRRLRKDKYSKEKEGIVGKERKENIVGKEFKSFPNLPVMQLNDFNRGKYLSRNIYTNATCPFRICGISHKGSTYRSPEEYHSCADQTDSIDVFSLGGVFFFLLSDGRKPYYGQMFDDAVDQIKSGVFPRLPEAREYRGVEEEVFLKERVEHPAYRALVEVMHKCWAHKPGKRPSSLEVVVMLEEAVRQIVASRQRRILRNETVSF